MAAFINTGQCVFPVNKPTFRAGTGLAERRHAFFSPALYSIMHVWPVEFDWNGTAYTVKIESRDGVS